MNFQIHESGLVYLKDEIVLEQSLLENTREDNLPGFYNSIVEKLVANRFDFPNLVSKSSLHFVELGIKIGLFQFLQHGGFDESDDIYFVADFNSRITNYREVKDFEEHYNVTSSSTFFQKISLMTSQKEKEISTRKDNSVFQSVKNQESLSHRVTIGLTVGSYDLFEQFLRSFKSCFENDLHSISIIICCFMVDSDEIQRMIQKSAPNLSSITILREEWGIDSSNSGQLGVWFQNEKHQSGVSFGRCVLHRALSEYADDGAIWILDDDVVFHEQTISELNNSIQSMTLNGQQVGIGAILGDPPIPPAYVLRTQAVDFYYAHIFANGAGSWKTQDQKSMHDIHHDLSTSRSDHLEIPLGLMYCKNPTLSSWSIFSGKSVTRPIHSEWDQLDTIPTRGGNTLILNKQPLRDWPNQAPMCENIQFRRGDTIWSKLIQKNSPELICAIPLSLEHIRRDSSESIGSIDSIRGDIFGSMYSRSLNEENRNAANIICNSLGREARLIMNLIRAHYLLNFLNHDKKQLSSLQNIIDELIATPYSKVFENELTNYIENESHYIRKFRRANNQPR
tara:strand:+ start:4177 stop:5871 length:1695 start_codon:yes stop_codon:yes gene_type:complete